MEKRNGGAGMKTMWTTEAEELKKYEETTWYRCFEIEKFIDKVQEEYKIVGIVFEGNNLGFILDKKTD